MDFTWERQAANGDPMPGDLWLGEQMAYQATAHLYARYRLGLISREKASAEKKLIKKALDDARREKEFRDRQNDYHTKLIRRTAIARAGFRRSPGVEAGMELCNAIDGIVSKRKD